MKCSNMFSAVLAVCCVAMCRGVVVKSCSKNPSDNIATVNWLHAEPNPLQLPGDLSLGVSVTLSRPITGNVNVDVTISRLFGLIWVDIPCVVTRYGRLGSCSYKNACDILAKQNGTICPNIFSHNKIPCTCPIARETYNIPTTKIPLDLKRLGIPLPLVAGDYQASFRVTDVVTQQEIVCFDIELTIADPPSERSYGGLGRFLFNLFG